MKTITRTLTSLAGAALLLTSLAACDPTEGNTGPGSGGAAESPEAPSSETPSPESPVQIDEIGGGETVLALDASFVSALAGLQLTPGVVGSAALDGTSITLPITGGSLEAPETDAGSGLVVEGEIEHTGSGISLAAPGGTTIDLTDFVLDADTGELLGTVSESGEVLGEQVPLLALDLGAAGLGGLDGSGAATLESVSATITDDAVALLNSGFGVDPSSPDALAADAAVGELTIAVEPAA